MYLFPPSLVDQDQGDALRLHTRFPNRFLIRPLRSSDYSQGFCAVLEHLTTTDCSAEQFSRRFHELRDATNYCTVVVEDTKQKRIAATATVILLNKFVHSAGRVGLIEDVVVHEDYRGKALGKVVIEQLKQIAVRLQCYKVILDCSEGNAPFYERCGFKRKELQMAYYVPAPMASKL
jgi:glucosamine-phosphate N-acetyltransferase